MLYKPANRPGFLGIVWEELQPYPGRLDLSLRMAILCVLVTVVAMANQVPEAALSCYLIFFASKDNSGSGIIIGLGLIVAASLGIMLGVLFLMIAADSPFLRLSFIVLFTFGGMYLSQASKLKEMAGTVGFVFAFIMTIYDIVPIAELLTRALTWMWVIVFFPMFFLVLLNVVAPRSPARLLRGLLADRLDTAAALADGVAGAATEARKLLGEGNERAGTYQRMARLLSLASRAETNRSGELIALSYEALSLALAGAESGVGADPRAAARLRELALTIREGRLLASVATTGGSAGLEALAYRIAGTLWEHHVPSPPEKEAAGPFLAPDALTNPRYTQFALKTLLAVMICYITYTALDWFEIHTAMITCFYVALGTTGETMHKLTLRIVGCLIGAAMGVGSIILFMPHMTDIGQLALLIGAGSLVAAWIANGSRRISYMGWQAALAFFLCTLGGFGPSFDLAVASNRIIGIIFGNVVVSLVFSTIWPVSVGEGVREALGSAARTLAGLVRRPASRESEASVAYFTAAHEAEQGIEFMRFEAERVKRREIPEELAAAYLSEINDLAAPMLLLSERDGGRLPTRGLPNYVKAATVRFENAVAQWLEESASAIKEGRWAAEPRGWDSPLGSVEAAFTRARRQAGAQGRRLPASIRDSMASRLRLYRQIDARIARMADVRAA